MEIYPDSLLFKDDSDHEPLEDDEEWTADRLWSAEPNLLRSTVSELIMHSPSMLQFYKQEVGIAKKVDSAVARDVRRYVGFPMVEAAAVVERVREIVNDPTVDTDLDYGWLNLSGVELKAPEEEQMKLAKPFSEPRYRPMKVLIDEIQDKTGIRLNRAVHDELSANQTQYYISWFLIEATDISWQQ